MPDGSAPTREVFGNIAPWMQGLFYLLIGASLAFSAWQVWKRTRLWVQGTDGEWERDPRVWARRLMVYALGQKRVRKPTLGGRLHALLFSGFLVLTLGTTLLFLADRGPVHFHRGSYYLLYELVMDLFGAALVAGCLLALYRRLAARPPSLGHSRSDYLLLSLLLLIGLTGFLLEGLRLRWNGTPPAVARWSPVGDLIAGGASLLFSSRDARPAHLAVWWLHAALIAAFFATFARTRFLHAVTGTLNIALRPSRPAGKLAAVSMGSVEQTGRIGASAIPHFTRQQLLSLDACMECGRCEDACPAFASGKPLSPKAVVVDLKRSMGGMGSTGSTGSAGSTGSTGSTGSAESAPSSHTPRTPRTSHTLIPEETLWSCTMCQACVFECPVLIGHVDLISDMRRHLVGEGQLSGPPAQALRRLAQGNPYGQPQGDRLAWAEGLAVPTVEQNPDFEVLLWVGCAASFDPRARKIARATAILLQRAGVNFAVLGRSERCTGDPARRLGEEFLFQQLAQENAAVLEPLAGSGGKRRRIVTPCPHCLNTLRNEYPDFDGHFDVVHHSQFLAELDREGKLTTETRRHGVVHGVKERESGRAGESGQPSESGVSPQDWGVGGAEPNAERRMPNTVTLHDPCYLARVNGETGAVRRLIEAAGGELREMPRHGARTFCCGAGGGRIWFEERPEQRVNRLRAQEAAATGAATLITACPFCLNMMTDGVAGIDRSESLRVLDIAELLLEQGDTHE